MSNANEIVAMALDKFADVVRQSTDGCKAALWRRPFWEVLIEKATAEAKALRSTPSPTPAEGLELCLFVQYPYRDPSDTHRPRYEPISEAVAVIEAARALMAVHDTRPSIGYNVCAKALFAALAALDKRLNPKVES